MKTFIIPFLVVLAISTSFSMAAIVQDVVKIDCVLSSAPGGKAYGQAIDQKEIVLIKPENADFYYGSYTYSSNGEDLNAIVNLFSDKTFKVSVLINLPDDSTSKHILAMTAEPLFNKVDVEFQYAGSNHHLLCK